MYNRAVIHNYYVYILKCKDETFYTGVTNDLERRLIEHNTGAIPNCYTYNKRPLELMYFEHSSSIHAAINREKQIKGWSRKKKYALILENMDKLKEFSVCMNKSSSKRLRLK